MKLDTVAATGHEQPGSRARPRVLVFVLRVRCGRVGHLHGHFKIPLNAASGAGHVHARPVEQPPRRLTGRAERELLAREFKLALSFGLAPVLGEQFLLGQRRHRGRDNRGNSTNERDDGSGAKHGVKPQGESVSERGGPVGTVVHKHARREYVAPDHGFDPERGERERVDFEFVNDEVRRRLGDRMDDHQPGLVREIER